MNKHNQQFAPATFSSIMDQRPQVSPWEHIVQTICDGRLAEITSRYRSLVEAHERAAAADERDRLSTQMRGLKKNLPAFLPSATVEGGRALRHVTGLSGFVMIDLDHIPAGEMESVRARLEADAHTFLLYTTVSGRGLRVVARVEGLTLRRDFRKAWSGVNFHYERLTGCATDAQCSNLTRISCLCHDERALFRPDARPFVLAELMGLPGSKRTMQNGNGTKQDAFGNGRSAYGHGQNGGGTKHNGGRRATALGAAATVRRMVEEEGVQYAPGSHNNYISRCLYLMNRFGVEQADALQWALAEFADYDAVEHSVESTVRSCYSLTQEHNILRLGDYSQKGRKGVNDSKGRGGMATVSTLLQWCAEHLESRLNIYLNRVEVRYLDRSESNTTDGGNGSESNTTDGGDGSEWHIMDDRDECSLWVRMGMDGIKTTPMQVHNLLMSHLSVMHDPLRHYLEGLDPWDGTTDHIAAFSAMVHVEGDRALFDDIFKRWLVGMLAGALLDDKVNHIILVLIGRQGVYKTTFVNLILPPLLRRYTNTMNSMRHFSKDEAVKLCENLILNNEEIDTMPTHELNRLKALVTEQHVNEREAFRRNKERRPHIASFIATGNKLEFLTDETGNRRWMPFHVLSIDNPLTVEINYPGIYAQAFHLLLNGFKYWLDGEDTPVQNKHLTQFEAPKPEYELVLSHFRKPGKLERASYYTSTQIVSRFGNCGIRLSPVKIGRVMTELGFEQVKMRRGTRFWIVAERSSDEIQHALPSEVDEPEGSNQGGSESDKSEDGSQGSLEIGKSDDGGQVSADGRDFIAKHGYGPAGGNGGADTHAPHDADDDGELPF